jgi:hypothetical protein
VFFLNNLYPILQTTFRLLRESMDLHRPRSMGDRISRMVSTQRLYWHWIRDVYTGPRVELQSNKKLTILLQSYLRPWNMDRLVRAAARCAFVDKIILSNNHPEIDLEPRLTLRDPRLVLIQNRTRRHAGFRWHLARDEDADYILSIDDDVFLSPVQITNLFQSLISDPEVPHGLFGTRYRGAPALTREERKKTESYVYQREEEADVLHRVYAVHRTHVNHYFRLLKGLGVHQSLTIGDDIVISFASKRRPQVHDVGPILSCPTSHQGGIAVHQNERFFSDRLIILNGLKDLRSLEPDASLNE